MRTKYIILLSTLGIISALCLLLVGAKAQKSIMSSPDIVEKQLPSQSDTTPQTEKKVYMKEGSIERKPGSSSIIANDPRPLLQAIDALREEYGLILDYEDPPYSTELVDPVDPQWRLSHPDIKGGAIPAGGKFQVEYDESLMKKGDASKGTLLKNIVSAYNNSGNPGKFTVLKEAEGRYAIIGKSVKDQEGKDKEITSILDTTISIPLEKRSMGETLELILKELSSKSGTTIDSPFTLDNLSSEVTVGGEETSARTLLLQTFKEANRPFIWKVMYEPNNKAYFFNLDIASQYRIDTYGRKSIVPLDATR